MKRDNQRGQTLGEAVVVLSIIAVLSAITVPQYPAVRRQAPLNQCDLQLHQIGLAIVQYRDAHQGKDPWPIGILAKEGLIPEDILVCPFVKKMRPEFVAAAQAYVKNKGRPAWSSYFKYSQRALDQLAQRGDAAYSYSEVWRRRGNDTPLVICRDHRENRAARNYGPPTWYFPTDPILILRFDGRVQKSRQGGTRFDNTWFGEEQDLVKL